MEMILLKRPEVAAKYKARTPFDIAVFVPGYSGPLSNINLSGAPTAVRTGYLEEIPPAPAAPGAAGGQDPHPEPSADTPAAAGTPDAGHDAGAGDPEHDN